MTTTLLLLLALCLSATAEWLVPPLGCAAAMPVDAGKVATARGIASANESTGASALPPQISAAALALARVADAARGGRWRESRRLSRAIICGDEDEEGAAEVAAGLERCLKRSASYEAHHRDAAVWLLARASLALGEVNVALRAYEALLSVAPTHTAAARQRRRLRRLESRLARAATFTTAGSFHTANALAALSDAATALDALVLRVVDGGTGFAPGHAGVVAAATVADGLRAALEVRVRIAVIECRARARDRGGEAFAEAQRACGAATAALGALRAARRQSDRAWSDSDEAAHFSRLASAHAAMAGAHVRDGGFDEARDALHSAVATLEAGSRALAPGSFASERDAAVRWERHGAGDGRVAVRACARLRAAALQRFAQRSAKLRHQESAVKRAEQKRDQEWSDHFGKQAATLRISSAEVRGASSSKARCRILKRRYAALAVRWHPDKVGAASKVAVAAGVSSTATWRRLSSSSNSSEDKPTTLLSAYRTPHAQRVRRSTRKFREVLQAKQELDDHWGCAKGSRAGEGRKARESRQRDQEMHRRRGYGGTDRHTSRRRAQREETSRQRHHAQQQQYHAWMNRQRAEQKRRRAAEEKRRRSNPRFWEQERERQRAHKKAERAWRERDARARAHRKGADAAELKAREERARAAAATAAESKKAQTRRREPGWTPSTQELHIHWEEQHAAFARWHAPSLRRRAPLAAAAGSSSGQTSSAARAAAFASSVSKWGALYGEWQSKWQHRDRAPRAEHGRWPPPAKQPRWRRSKPKSKSKSKPKRRVNHAQQQQRRRRRQQQQRRKEVAEQQRKAAVEAKRVEAKRVEAKRAKAMRAEAMRVEASRLRAEETARIRVAEAAQQRMRAEEERGAAQRRFNEKVEREDALRRQRQAAASEAKQRDAQRSQTLADAQQRARWQSFAAKKQVKNLGAML